MSNAQTNYLQGDAALDALNQTDDGGSGAEFTSFKSGTTLLVKVLGMADLMSFYSYGIFGKVNSFVAAQPSKKSAKGYPVGDHTPWDRAWQYHKDLSKDFNDAHGVEAGKYRAKQRFAMAFYDLDAGATIIVDVSKNQAQAIHGAIKKYEKRLGKLAFELTKSGQSTSTTVSLSPVLDMDEDLTDKQRDNFAKAPESFEGPLFEGLLYEADEAEQIQLLTQAGFDVRRIGIEPAALEAETTVDNTPVDPDDLPF